MGTSSDSQIAGGKAEHRMPAGADCLRSAANDHSIPCFFPENPLFFPGNREIFQEKQGGD
jgi:hypothetical protein